MIVFLWLYLFILERFLLLYLEIAYLFVDFLWGPPFVVVIILIIGVVLALYCLLRNHAYTFPWWSMISPLLGSLVCQDAISNNSNICFGFPSLLKLYKASLRFCFNSTLERLDSFSEDEHHTGLYLYVRPLIIIVLLKYLILSNLWILNDQ